MFFPQEYQYVHLLWFKKRSFHFSVWKPNPLLRSVCCAHLRARADKPGSLHMKRSRWKRLSSRDQWNLTPSCYNVPRLFSARCMKQTLWSSLDHALAQVRPCQIFTLTFSKNGCKCDHFGRSLEPWVTNNQPQKISELKILLKIIIKTDSCVATRDVNFQSFP